MSDNNHDQAHEDHTGPVKTPKQMLMLSFASFVIPVFIIIGLVYYVTLANKTAPGGDTRPNVLPATTPVSQVLLSLRMQVHGHLGSKRVTTPCLILRSKAKTLWVHKAAAIAATLKLAVLLPT